MPSNHGTDVPKTQSAIESRAQRPKSTKLHRITGPASPRLKVPSNHGPNVPRARSLLESRAQRPKSTKPHRIQGPTCQRYEVQSKDGPHVPSNHGRNVSGAQRPIESRAERNSHLLPNHGPAGVTFLHRRNPQRCYACNSLIKSGRQSAAALYRRDGCGAARANTA